MQLRVFCFRTLALSNRIKTSQTWGANTKSEKNNCSLLCDLHDFKKGHHQTSSDGYLSRNKGKQQKNKEFWQQCWLIWGHIQVINDLNYNSILCLIEIIFLRKDILGKKAQTRQYDQVWGPHFLTQNQTKNVSLTLICRSHALCYWYFCQATL